MRALRLNGDRGGYALVRSLILAVSTLAIVGVLFAVYQYSTSAPQPPEIVPGSRDVAIEATPDAGSASLSGGPAPLGPGGVIRLSQYDPGSSHVRRELEVTSWRPIGDVHGDIQRIEVTDPVIRGVLPDGQLVRIRANGGSLDVTADFDPRRGALSGDVRIDIDRRSGEQRLKSGTEDWDGESDAPWKVRLSFESLTFDMVASRLETSGPFSMRMAEADVDGDGLRLEYNEEDRRLEHFEILERGSIALRGAGRLFDTVVPGDAETGAEPTGAGMNQTAVTPAVPVVSAEYLQAYRVNIDDDVSIRRFDGDTVVRRLDADRLNVLYDFDVRTRDRIQSAAAPSATNAAADSPADGAAPDALAGNSAAGGPAGVVDGGTGGGDGRLVLEWSGRLLVRPEVETPVLPAPARVPRFHMIATGREVRFTDRQGEALCRTLEVQRDAARVRMSGDADRRVVLTMPERGTLTAPEVSIDRKAAVIRIAGPARMAGGASNERGASSGGRAYDLRFEDSAELTLGTRKVWRIDPVSDASRFTTSEYIQSAAFRGDVVLRQGADVVAGDSVAMAFDPPTSRGTMMDHLRSFTADGHVLQVRGDDRLTADHLQVDFVTGPSGGAMPRSARARGDVVITQGDLMVAARDTVTLDMVPVVKPKPVFDAVGARASAVLRGQDPGSIDWERVRAEHESKTEYTAGLKRVEASGDVHAYDASRGLDLSAASVVGEFADGRRITTAQVTGPPDRDAFIRFGDMSITAHRIDTDLEAERADVFGAGRLSFVTHRGLDGSRSATPQEVEVRWTQEMAYRGSKNTARCVGEVHAVSRRRLPPKSASPKRPHSAEAVADRVAAARPTGEAGRDVEPASAVVSADVPADHAPATLGVLETAAIDSDEMVIDFVDTAPPAKPDLNEQWWIFAPLVRRWAGPEEPPPVQFNKEPAYIMASRNVVAVFANIEVETNRVKNRVRLESSKLTADLRAELLTVPAAGTLLIEDYQRPQTSASNPQDRAAGLFGQWSGNEPSQTYVSWAGSLSFHASRYRADFRDDVLLMHRSGGAIAFAETLLDHQTFVPESSADGMRSRLSCGALMIEFAGRSAPAPNVDTGLGDMSLRKLRQLEATGGVVLDAGAFTVEASRIVKYENSDLLRVFGAPDAEAEIFSDPPDGPRFRGPEFNFNLRSSEITAPQFQMRGRN